MTTPSDQPLSDEQIDAAVAAARDELLDHIYEYGTTSEGVLRLVRRIARAALASQPLSTAPAPHPVAWLYYDGDSLPTPETELYQSVLLSLQRRHGYANETPLYTHPLTEPHQAVRPPSQPSTPSSHWKAAGEPDPHDARYYDQERATLCMGHLTDDELANGAFMNYDRIPSVAELVAGKPTPMVWMTAVKDRIRWLSRALEKALAATPAAPPSQPRVWHFDGVPPVGSTCLVWVKPSYSKEPYYTVDNYGEQHEAPVSWSSATIPIGDGWDSFDHEDVIAWSLLDDAGPAAAPAAPASQPVAPAEPMFLVCAGGDGYQSEIVPQSRLDDAYLLTQWGNLDDITPQERADALEHFHDPDEWTYLDPLRGREHRIPVEFGLSLEDGWIRVVRLPPFAAAVQPAEAVAPDRGAACRC